jgi:hypothetical protein
MPTTRFPRARALGTAYVYLTMIKNSDAAAMIPYEHHCRMYTA